MNQIFYLRKNNLNNYFDKDSYFNTRLGFKNQENVVSNYHFVDYHNITSI